jgi:pimeloyl-ACP methyl ester carboxylesterase
MQTIHFQVEYQLQIVADAYGDPQKPAVLLLHGGGQTRHSWGDTAQQIAAAGWYALALDARGHGDSDWSAQGQYQIEYLANDLRSVIRQVGGRPALVGASMGGITSLVVAGESSEHLCSAVVLVDIAPKAEQRGIERIFAFMSANAESGFSSLDEAAEAVAAYLPHRPKPTDYRRLEKNLRQRADGRWYWHWDPAMLRLWKENAKQPDYQAKAETRLYTAAQQLNVPTLIVRGGISDVVSERVMVEFPDAVPHVRSVTVSDAGHMVAGDSNHAFSNAVIEFLNEIYPPLV